MTAASSKKTILILLDKVKIIHKLEKGFKQIDVVKEPGLKHSTVNSVWLKYKSIMYTFESGVVIGS